MCWESNFPSQSLSGPFTVRQQLGCKEGGSTAAAAAKLLQSCPTLCDPIDGSPPGYPIPGILQAKTLEWVAVSFSNEWKWKVKLKSLSHVWLLATPWTAACQVPLSMGFSRQEYWSGLPLPSLILLRDTMNTWVTCFLRILNPGSLGHLILDWVTKNLWSSTCLKIRHWVTLIMVIMNTAGFCSICFFPLDSWDKNIFFIFFFFIQIKFYSKKFCF